VLGHKDGILYLGTCAPEFIDSQATINYSRDKLFQFRRGFYFCTHAIAYTKWRSRTIWGDFSSYFFRDDHRLIDIMAERWQVRSKCFPFSVAQNINWPSDTDHYGFFYQDREAKKSLLNT
jgi:hypothetical protein